MAKFTDTMLKCWLYGEEVPCGELFFGRFSVTDAGQCFTFNHNGTIERGPLTLSWTYGLKLVDNVSWLRLHWLTHLISDQT